MKLYIPILLSNIDNVLTSESISPSCFYEKQGFGYKTFDKLPETPSVYTLLYSELKHCPSGDNIIYIEWNDNYQQKDLKKVGENLYYSDHTLILYPWYTKILFTNTYDYERAVTFCRGSLNNKFWKYFEFKLANFLSTNNIGNAPFVKDVFVKDTVFKDDSINSDKIRNRLKGFVFGHYIGQKISLSPDLANLRKYGKQISDLCSVIPTMPQDMQNEYIKEINRIKNKYNNLNPKRKELKAKWNDEVLGKFSTDNDREFFNDLAKRYNFLKTMMDVFAKEKDISTGPSVIEATQKNNWKEFKNQLNEYTDKILSEYKNNDDINNILDIKNGRIEIYGIKDFYNEILNALIGGDELLQADNVTSNRLEVASQLTVKIKDSIEKSGEKWEESPEYKFYNDLRQNISSSNGFDLSVVAPDDMAATLAIYILRCDDFEDMIRYSVASGYGRYDLLLALWGANKGYVDLPKTIFSFLHISKSDVENAYSKTYEVIPNVDKELHSLNNYSNELVNDFQDKEVKITQDLGQLNDFDMAQILKTKDLKLSKGQQEAILDIYNKCNQRINDNFFKAVGKIKNVGKTKIRRLKDALHYAGDVASAPMLPLNKTVDDRLLMLDDWKTIKDYCGLDQINIKRIYSDLLWFLSSKNPGRKNISSYIKYIEDRKFGKNPKLYWLKPHYKDVDVDGIYNALVR